jgi:hypothetical protein
VIARPSYRQLLDRLHCLEEICAMYVVDEERFRDNAGEPYGSIPTEARVIARSARDRAEQRQTLKSMLKSATLTKATMAGAVRERYDRHAVVIHLLAATPDPTGFLASQTAICGSSPSRGWSDWLPVDGPICPKCERRLARLRSSMLSA